MKNSLSIRECTAAEYAGALTELAGALDESVSFLQAPFYGVWQEHDGKQVVYFAVRDGPRAVAAGTAVLYSAPGGLRFYYAPYGPVTLQWSAGLFAALEDFFAPIARRDGASFVRFDSYPAGMNGVADHLAATASLQPRAEWLVPLDGTEQALLAGLNKSARRNIRAAERTGAEMQFFTPAETPLDTFLDLMHTTTQRNSFSAFNRAYYAAMLQAMRPEDGFAALCTIAGKPAAMAMFALYDATAHYVFAASANEFRKVGPSYLMVWRAMLEAKKRGCRVLDLGGITHQVKGRHLAGVTEFKKRFGGYEVQHPNPVDLVYNRRKYFAFSLYKRTRR